MLIILDIRLELATSTDSSHCGALPCVALGTTALEVTVPTQLDDWEPEEPLWNQSEAGMTTFWWGGPAGMPGAMPGWAPPNAGSDIAGDISEAAPIPPNCEIGLGAGL